MKFEEIGLDEMTKHERKRLFHFPCWLVRGAVEMFYPSCTMEYSTRLTHLPLLNMMHTTDYLDLGVEIT